MDKQFKVSAEWLKACGKGDQERVFTVTKVREYPWAGPGFRKMITVDDNGHPWVVAEARGHWMEGE
jgi:hypothetical protein